MTSLNLDGVDLDAVRELQRDPHRIVEGWQAPIVLPPSWREVERDDLGGTKYMNAQASLAAILSCAYEGDGRAWLHLSVSHRLREPTWGEFRTTKELFLGDREAYQVMPPKARYINIHPHVLHLFALLDEKATAVLPDFTGGTGSL